MVNAYCAALEGTGTRVGAELVSFFATSTAYNVILIYAIEPFPDVVAELGGGDGVRLPMVLAWVGWGGGARARRRERTLWWSFAVFGIAIGCSGIFAALPAGDEREELVGHHGGGGGAQRGRRRLILRQKHSRRRCQEQRWCPRSISIQWRSYSE
ncbi:hypothetical protein HU200_018186 [Digitaria exilis]|uniref:Uncharacterized protein n=1 Tax=Digitaria exilis TaxID=1010633 RepID=A0A835F576_9POAL|nr:hypothetical protein HU200_018186 [Digitaria exilis]